MDKELFKLESSKRFSESILWQINRDYYEQEGINAWRNGVVPHHMTSNSMVGKTYAELILAFLKDLSAKGRINETVYLIELGAGHGRLAYHTLQHLKELTDLVDIILPSFCYVLSDIIEEDLLYFQNHPQLKHFFEQGTLDYANFDAIGGTEIHLQHANKTIRANDLKQPLIVIANYFFDSIPNDLFRIKDEEISVCSVSLKSSVNPNIANASLLLENLIFSYESKPIERPFYGNSTSNEILEEYGKLGFDTYMFFPQKGIECLAKLAELSREGLMLLSMDKGYHEFENLNHKKEPEIVTHGSFSLSVNYHAIGAYCEKNGGKSLFSQNSNFHLEMGCLLFIPENDKFSKTIAAYNRFVNDFGPDDFNSIKRLTYSNIASLNLLDLIAVLRLSAYDATLFGQFLPRIKELTQEITNEERRRVGQLLHRVWHFYFNIGEPLDLAYSIGGLFYDLGYYQSALDFFRHSAAYNGPKVDTYYNSILCFYQLRRDTMFVRTLNEAQNMFPEDLQLKQLHKLDLNAA